MTIKHFKITRRIIVIGIYSVINQLLNHFLSLYFSEIFIYFNMILFPIVSLQPKVAYYENKLGMVRSIDSSVGHNSLNCENKLFIGAEVPGKVRAHLLHVGYSKFYFLKLKCINTNPNIFKCTLLFLSLSSTCLQQIFFQDKIG